jgi:hypothetical protein
VEPLASDQDNVKEKDFNFPPSYCTSVEHTTAVANFCPTASVSRAWKGARDGTISQHTPNVKNHPDSARRLQSTKMVRPSFNPQETESCFLARGVGPRAIT